MHLRRWKFAAAAVLVLPLLRCAGATPGGQVGGPAPPPPSPRAAARFATPAEAEAALVALEDRRAFDASVL